LLTGFGAAAIAFLCFQLPALLSFSEGLSGDAWTCVRLVLLVGGALLVGAAVAQRPRSPLVLLAAAFIAWLVGFGMDPAWDTARLVMLILATVALLAAALVALPALLGRVFVIAARTTPPGEAEARGRRVGSVLSRGVVSLLVILHFVGIIASVLANPLPSRDSSWVANWIAGVWRPYLHFCYLKTSFRFYSPEPGPALLLWFYVQYSDGTGLWVKLPDRELGARDPAGQEMIRQLLLCYNAAPTLPPSGVPEAVRDLRLAEGKRLDIPTHPELPISAQYQVPYAHCQRSISQYARFVAQHYPAENPQAVVTGVKAYRVVHLILDPNELSNGRLKLNEPWTYLPFYQGTFSPEGKLTDPKDAFLYWLIPIHAWPHGAPPPKSFETIGPLPLASYERLDVHDYLNKHARLRPDAEGDGR
jgi:hypothetical protein